MQQVHGIDNQCAVGGVLAGGVSKLLLRVQGMGLEGFLPSGHLRRGPVAVDPSHRCRAVLGRFRQDISDQRRLGVVAVDQQGHVTGLVLKFLWWRHGRRGSCRGGPS